MPIKKACQFWIDWRCAFRIAKHKLGGLNGENAPPDLPVPKNPLAATTPGFGIAGAGGRAGLVPPGSLLVVRPLG